MRLVKLHHTSLAILLALCAMGAAEEKPLRFPGEVKAGQSFRKPIGHGLAFVLAGDDDGWIIEVQPEVPRGEACKGYSTVIATPLHGYTQNDLNVTYGVSAADAVKRPRAVEFVLDQAACKLESQRLERLSHPGSFSDAEVESARQTFGTSPTGKAMVRILHSKISAQDKIEWIKFEVTITFPPGR
jgi:hypothetical protein